MSKRFFGFIGAHRTGKTTLARSTAKKLGVPFYETTVSQTLASHGINPQADMPFEDRLDMQEFVLRGLMDDYSIASEKFSDAPFIVVDRTPLDVLGYTISEVLRSTLDADLEWRLTGHAQRTYQAFNFNFFGGVLVPPGIAVVSDATKGTANVHYQRHIHCTMLGSVTAPAVETPVLCLSPTNLELSSRTNDSAAYARNTLNELRFVERSDHRVTLS